MADTYKNLFMNLFQSVAACEAPEGTQVDDVLEGFQRFYDEAKRPTPTWTIEVDHEGRKRIKCPRCGGLDTIVEVDHAIRFNELELNGDSYLPGSSAGDADDVIARMGEEGDWDFDHWYCQSCHADDLLSPVDFKIQEWV